ncbi:MAG: rhomboid family intramembrane serine protease [Thermodesulfobacteriota bacterium]|nr:MAG: rhomboid family intramembrane serine protease [Thermodesulfobacteriota bacterium]
MIPLKDDTPRETFPYVTIAIIVINVLVFVYEIALGYKGMERFIYSTAAIPYEVTHFTDIGVKALVPPPFTLFTAMFVHGGFFHVGGNMLFLWIFGDNIEDSLGHFKFIVFYLLMGLIASFAQIMLTGPSSQMPMIGASGAIAGVLGAYLLLFPRAQVITLIFLIFFVTLVRIPAVFFLALWFLFQLLSSGSGGSVAWFAHIGGFVAGLALIKLFHPKVPRGRIFMRT